MLCWEDKFSGKPPVSPCLFRRYNASSTPSEDVDVMVATGIMGDDAWLKVIRWILFTEGYPF